MPEYSKTRTTTWKHHLQIGIKLLWATCLCQPSWERGPPSSGLFSHNPLGLQVLLRCGLSPLLSCHVHLPLGKRLHGEGFFPTCPISQDSGQANPKWEANSIALCKVITSQLPKRRKTCRKMAFCLRKRSSFLTTCAGWCPSTFPRPTWGATPVPKPCWQVSSGQVRLVC